MLQQVGVELYKCVKRFGFHLLRAVMHHVIETELSAAYHIVAVFIVHAFRVRNALRLRGLPVHSMRPLILLHDASGNSRLFKPGSNGIFCAAQPRHHGVSEHVSDVRARVGKHCKIPPCRQSVCKGRRDLTSDVRCNIPFRLLLFGIRFRVQELIHERRIDADRVHLPPVDILAALLVHFLDAPLEVIRAAKRPHVFEHVERLHRTS